MKRSPKQNRKRKQSDLLQPQKSVQPIQERETGTNLPLQRNLLRKILRERARLKRTKPPARAAAVEGGGGERHTPNLRDTVRVDPKVRAWREFEEQYY